MSDWQEVTLGDLIHELPKSKRMAKDAKESGVYPFFVCSATAKRSDYADYTEEAIILSTGGGAYTHYCNTNFSASGDTWAFATNQIRLDTKYAYYYLEHKKKSIQDEGFQGSGLKHLQKDFIRNMNLLLPPLPEQKKIAEILSGIDAEISALEAEVDKVKNYTIAISKRIFLGLMLDGSVLKYPAEDLCSLVTKGTTPSKSATAQSKSVPFLRVTNLGFNGTIDPTQDFELITQESHKGELKRSVCRPGDVLMNIVGPPLGKIGIIPQEIGECNINQAVLVYRIAADRLDPSFFVHFLLGQVAQSWFHSQSKKTSGQQNLTIETCKSLAVPLPSMSEQKKFSGCLNSLSALASRLVKKQSSLKFLKSAVSSDLLSGRKRVSV